MNILRVIATMNPANGGPCQVIRNAALELAKYNHHFEVVSLDNPDSDFLGKDSFPVHALGPTKSPWLYSPKLIPWLTANLKRFDAVVIEGLWLYHSYAVNKVLHRLKNKRKTAPASKLPKLYIMPHGMLDPWFQRASTRKLKAIRNWFYWKVVEADVVNQADGLLFTCEVELLLAREPFTPYRPKKEINIGLGIGSSPPFRPAMHESFIEKCPSIKGCSYFLFLSRIHEKKGVDLLVDAYSKFQYKSHSLPKLVVAGPGIETPYGQRLKKFISENEFLRANIFLTDMLTGNAKWGAFYGCEAFVLPSHQENFGIAVVEALACGKPVLISNQVNIWKEIKEIGGGFIAPDTVNGTLENLENWVNLPKHSKDLMGQQAQKCFKQHFAIEPASVRLIDAISAVN